MSSLFYRELKSPPYLNINNHYNYATAVDSHESDVDINEYYNHVDENDIATQQEAKNLAKLKLIKEELKKRSGRLFNDPYHISHEMWGKSRTISDLPDWNKNMSSRTSNERVRVYEDGIPSIKLLASFQKSLPTSYPPHPALGSPKSYTKYRNMITNRRIYEVVSRIAQPKMESILSIADMNSKQEAIDKLFEYIHNFLCCKKSNSRKKSSFMNNIIPIDQLSIWKSHPEFPLKVEKNIEEFLKNFNKTEKINPSASFHIDRANKDAKKSGIHEPSPFFIDFLKEPECQLDENNIPTFLHPLTVSPKDSVGRMVEEWNLSSHQETKRIMMRECMSSVANELQKKTHDSLVYVHGVKGVGKTTLLALITASARKSGHVVLYIPDSNRLVKRGYYNEASSLSHRQLFDLPILSQEFCSNLLYSHKNKLDHIIIYPQNLLEIFFCQKKLKILRSELLKKGIASNDQTNLTSILNIATRFISLASPCFEIVLYTLMNQSSIPFTIIIDEFNCYFGQSHYYNELYDKRALNSIPLEYFTLFRPFFQLMGLSKDTINNITYIPQTKVSTNTNILVGTTHSHAISPSVTSSLTQVMKNNDYVSTILVPPYSPKEVNHIISNFEIIGIGRLRFDKGEILMNEQEVAYLRMISEGVGQNLFDSCIN